MQTYLFYDLETSGLNPAFDQILQFAAIRTDMAFQELERHEIRVRLRPDVIVSPGALITHRIPLSRLMEGETEYDAVCRIHALFNTPGTISLGYNTLGFDDTFLRFSFYRNLLPPYTHQYAGGCRRMDVFPMTVFFHLFKPDVILWPEINGRTTLKLEHICAKNNLAEGPAHDAMVDVDATVALAKRLFAETKMWDYLAGYFDKDADIKRMHDLPEAFRSVLGIHRYGLMVAPEFGYDARFLAPVLDLGRSIPYSNQSLWLRLDQKELAQTDPDHVAPTCWVIRKRNGEPGMLLPPADRFWSRLDPERLGIVKENLKWLHDNPEILAEIITYYREFSYEDIPGIDPDAALYQNGFFSRSDQALCKAFHVADITEKQALVRKFSNKVSPLAERILFRNGYQPLSDGISAAQEDYWKHIVPDTAEEAPLDWRGQHRITPSAARDEIATLRAKGALDPEQEQLLSDLESDLKDRFGAFVS